MRNERMEKKRTGREFMALDLRGAHDLPCLAFHLHALMVVPALLLLFILVHIDISQTRGRNPKPSRGAIEINLLEFTQVGELGEIVLEGGELVVVEAGGTGAAVGAATGGGGRGRIGGTADGVAGGEELGDGQAAVGVVGHFCAPAPFAADGFFLLGDGGSY